MSREEEIEKEAEKYAYKGVDDEFKPMVKGIAIYLINAFKTGAEFADQHQKGLWDADKVTEWLKNNVNDYLDWYDWEQCRVNKDELLYDLRKAMEE